MSALSRTSFLRSRARGRASTIALCAASSLTAALTGCELSRPEGAFTPVYPEAGPELSDFGDGDGDTGDGDSHMSMNLLDAGQVIETSNEMYKDLVGYYLARFDEHSTSISDVGPPVGSISSKNLVSRFFLVAILEKDGKLTSIEKMCGQIHKNACSGACTGTSTRIIPKAVELIRTTSPAISRELSLNSEGVLKAPMGSTYLGFNGTASDHALPANPSDKRVWDSVPTEPGNEGLYTELKISVKSLGITQSLTCQVSIVQELHLSWSATLASGLKLDGARGTFATTGTGDATKILDAKADPSDKRDDCMGTGTGGTDTPGDKVVQFKKMPVTACPSVADFEKAILPDADPTAGP